MGPENGTVHDLEPQVAHELSDPTIEAPSQPGAVEPESDGMEAFAEVLQAELPSEFGLTPEELASNPDVRTAAEALIGARIAEEKLGRRFMGFGVQMAELKEQQDSALEELKEARAKAADAARILAESKPK